MKAWDRFLALQEKELGVETVQKWLRPLKVSHFDARNLHLVAADSFQILWFDEHIRPKLAKFLTTNSSRIKVHLTLGNQGPPAKTAIRPATKKQSNEQVHPQRFDLSFDLIDPHMTFDAFVEGEGNALALKLLKGLAGEAGKSAVFNPIYIHGPSGTGKTHLLMAAAQALQEAGRSVLFARAETFTDHVVSAIRAGEMSIFRKAYRNSDVLILDDVHVLARKSATQEELFHTFNTLHVAGKQILLSANCNPGDLEMIEPRLVSRFEWGIVAGLERFNAAKEKEVLEKKMATLHFPLHPKVVDYLMESFPSGNKAIGKALQALILRTHLNKDAGILTSTQLTVPQVKHFLADLVLEEERSALTPEKIIRLCAEQFGITAEDILGSSKLRECVLPRQLAMYFCRNLLNAPFLKIGQTFSKDHSTVMSSVKRIQKALESNDKDISQHYTSILKKIENSAY